MEDCPNFLQDDRRSRHAAVSVGRRPRSLPEAAWLPFMTAMSSGMSERVAARDAHRAAERNRRAQQRSGEDPTLAVPAADQTRSRSGTFPVPQGLATDRLHERTDDEGDLQW